MHTNLKQVGIGAICLAIGASCLWLGLSLHGNSKALLIGLAGLAAMSAVAVSFGTRVLGGVLAIVGTGMLFGGSLWLASSTTTVVQVTGFILAYLTWLGFSACLFGVPVMLLPFPPFLVFAWRRLSEQQRKDMFQRLLTIGILASMIAGVSALPRWGAAPAPLTTSTDSPSDHTLAANMRRAAVAAIEKEATLGIRSLSISVSEDRVVTLSGLAANANSRERAESLVAQLPGVVRVINTLRVE